MFASLKLCESAILTLFMNMNISGIFQKHVCNFAMNYLCDMTFLQVGDCQNNIHKMHINISGFTVCIVNYNLFKLINILYISKYLTVRGKVVRIILDSCKYIL